LTPDEWAYIASFPPYLRIEAGGKQWIVVHGGFEAGVPFYKQDPEKMCVVRWVDEKGERAKKKRVGCTHWAERWEGPQSVVYGHTGESLEHVQIRKRKAGVVCAGLDTGACFGGRLSALLLPSMEVIQVQAKKAYADWHGPDGKGNDL